ncbi:MAG: flavodoxin family protein [Bacteroidaceae bacterium]|jgi:NAD(P)H-dependent FMN reductase
MNLKNILYIVVISVMTLFASCGNGEKQQSEGPDRYGINYSDTSTIKKTHKNVLVISASPRRQGNTDLLCDEFARGAQEVGARVEKIFLGDYNIAFFQEADERHVGDSADVATDDAPMIVRKMLDADIIVLASPVYFMNINGQMKTLIDRTYSHFMDLKDKEFYYITACADNAESTADFAIAGFRGFVMCLPNPTERGMIKAIGLGRKGSVKGTVFMQQAYELGKGV